MGTSRRHCEPEHRLLTTLARHGRFAAATTLFFTFHRPTTAALNTLLSALCSSSSSSHLRAAPAILLLAAPSYASPDAATFRILTTALCRSGRPAAAASVLRSMPPLLLLSPSPRHCRSILSSLCRNGGGGGGGGAAALAFLDDMRRWGVTPDRGDHALVVGALLRDGMVDEAYEFVVRGMDPDGGGVVVPGVPEFERLLRGFRSLGRIDRVEEVFDEMLLRGLVPPPRVYQVYLAALCDAGGEHVAAARRMLKCMHRAGSSPDVRTVGVVVAGCVAAGDVEGAREVVREAVGRGLRWDRPAVAELVADLRAGGRLAAARPLLVEILRDGEPVEVDAEVAVAVEEMVGAAGAECSDGGDEDDGVVSDGEAVTR